MDGFWSYFWKFTDDSWNAISNNKSKEQIDKDLKNKQLSEMEREMLKGVKKIQKQDLM